jgi:ABC-type transport system substrate-binding protein
MMQTVPNVTHIGCLALLASIALSTRAQDAPTTPDKPTLPLLQQEPFDLITLDEANNSLALKVEPLPLPGRKKPRNPDPRAKIRVRLMDKSEEGEYDVFWRNIKRVRLYEEMLLAEAERLTVAKEYDDAFDYYYKVGQEYPTLAGFDRSFNRYLYLDSVNLTRLKRFTEAFGVVEELYRREPGFRYSANAPTLMTFLGGLLDRMIEAQLEQRQYDVARSLLARVRDQYGVDRLPSLQGWIDQLVTLATQKHNEARALLEADEYRDAIRASKQMMAIWPEVEGATELSADIAESYPMVTVGVLQPAVLHDARRLDNWSALRTGQLVRRSLVEFLGAGPEGGQYSFARGLIERSDDQRGLILRLNQGDANNENNVTGYEVARRLLDMASPQSHQYVSAWGGLVESVHVQNVMQVTLRLRRPHVLPEALLRVPLRPDEVSLDEFDATAGKAEIEAPEAIEGDGAFRIAEKSSEQVQFLAKDFRPGSRLAEVVEFTYESSQQALSALRRGEIDVVDRLFPADAVRIRESLSSDSPIVVEQYALPTVHMLLVNKENPFLANRDFRRAVAFAIDRDLILNQELLGGREIEGCTVLSGPFPAGVNDRDPLAYAYDTTIESRQYTPRLAKLLTIVSVNHITEMATNRMEVPPILEPFVLGYPAHEAARVAAQSIVAQLQLIGIECRLKELPPGLAQDPDGECDLTYAEIAIWEPVIDARRLLGERGIAPAASPYVRQSLRWLDQAQNWGEVREKLLGLHRISHNEATLIPLWQTVDFFAYNKRIRNIGESPVWLYQNIDQWRVGSNVTAE